MMVLYYVLVGMWAFLAGPLFGSGWRAFVGGLAGVTILWGVMWPWLRPRGHPPDE